MDIAKSVLQKLRNKAQKTGVSFQLILQLFCQEEFLRRLGYSKYQDNLVLQGGLLLYLITQFESRPTMDQEAIFETINNRRRRYEKDTLEKVEFLKEDTELLSRWKMFIENTLEINLSFEQVIVNVVNFIGGPFESIVYEEEFFLAWDKSEGKWR